MIIPELYTYFRGQGGAFFGTKNHVVVMSVWCPGERDVKLHHNSLLGETQHMSFHLSMGLGQVCIKTWVRLSHWAHSWVMLYVPQVLGIRARFKPFCSLKQSWVWFFACRKYGDKLLRVNFIVLGKLSLVKRAESNTQRHYRVKQPSMMGLCM